MTPKCMIGGELGRTPPQAFLYQNVRNSRARIVNAQDKQICIFKKVPTDLQTHWSPGCKKVKVLLVLVLSVFHCCIPFIGEI